MEKQTFGVIVTTRDFFPSHLVAAARNKTTALLKSLGYDWVMVGENDTKLGAVRTYDQAKVCANIFKQNAEIISGIIVIMPNFGEEAGVADAIGLANLGVPILIQACDDDYDKLDMQNRRDAFCGKLSLCNNLYQRGIPFTDTTTHTCKIDSDDFAADVNRFAAVCRVVKGLKNARIGLLGARPTAFRTVRFSEKILHHYGVDIETADMSEIIAAANAMADQKKISEKIAEIRGYGTISSSISDGKVERQARLCLAIEEKVEAMQCDASAVQCWDSIQNNYGCATCLAMSMMGEKGRPSACESDVTGALTMYALSLASRKPTAYMDWNNNVREDRNMCISLHCSNFPKSFFGRDIEIENLDVLATTLGADNCFGACKGQVVGGDMTYCKITTDDMNGIMKLYVGEGQFTDEVVPTKGGVASCNVPGLQGLLKYICQNGFEHHVAFARGHLADIIEEAFSKYIGAKVYHHKG